MHFVPLVVILLLSAALSLQAEDPLPNVERLQSSPVLRHLRPNPMPQAPRTGPEQTLAQMYVPEGFRVDLVAAEPDLQQPIAFLCFVQLGRSPLLAMAEANQGLRSTGVIGMLADKVIEPFRGSFQHLLDPSRGQGIVGP